jgi:hypothetical protein
LILFTSHARTKLKRTACSTSCAIHFGPRLWLTSSPRPPDRLTQWGATTLSSDLNGNVRGDGATTYIWNARDELSSLSRSGATLPSFGYDAFGRRRQQTTGAAVTAYETFEPDVLRSSAR